MTSSNSLDEWRAAALAEGTVFATAATAFDVQRARDNHAAAEGVDYA